MITTPSEGSKTGAKKTFGIFSMIDRVDLIEEFIESQPRHCDDELPFKSQDLPLNDQSCKHEFLRGVQDFVLNEILNIQWHFLAPVFRRNGPGSSVQNLSEGVILPISEIKEQRPLDIGHSGTVAKVMVHADHYVHEQESGHFTNAGRPALDSNGMMPCAIKQLHLVGGERYQGHYKDACEKEFDNLLRVRELRHDNLIELLFGYMYKERCYLVFPWADGNLGSFWRDHFPTADMLGPQDHLAKWIFSQAQGLVEGLELVHGNGAGSAPSGQGAATHGTHGDLKPQNILWFMGQSKLDELPNLGHLKISDFGGTQFHRKVSKSRVNWNELHTTDTYQAPETVTGYMVGQRYDLWSLGCVLLEFATWFIQGWQGVDNFSKARSVDSDPSDASTHNNGILLERYEKRRQRSNWADYNRHSTWPADTFFYLLPQGAQRHVFGARLKRSVQNASSHSVLCYHMICHKTLANHKWQHLNDLYKHAKCSRFCADFLKVIEECFLRMNKKNRVSTNEILQRFEKIKRAGESDTEYWTEPPKTPVRARTNLSDLVAEEPDLEGILEASYHSSQRRNSPEDGHYVEQDENNHRDQSPDRSQMAVSNTEAPQKTGYLVPIKMEEGNKRNSYTSSQTAVSLGSVPGDFPRSTDGYKTGIVDEMGTAEARVGSRKRDRMKGCIKRLDNCIRAFVQETFFD
ncbi:hypothetical protein PG997_005324 [Apiospora hydei]|uniref:Protein kinase domain-containing protein n=1 Tax=Apiospora hydei TaxID=1337664 RepID=A0ABR1X4M4_9PEZI